MTEIVLAGCRPEPLASYLKSLAVLRLVSEQKDCSAKGYWEGDLFCVRTTLNADQLMQFFLEEYSPTPVVAPWNGGSGFYEGDQREGLEAIRSSESLRFADFREAIQTIFMWPEMPPTAQPLGQILTRLDAAAATKTGKAQAGLLRPVEEVRTAIQRASGLLASEDILQLSVDDLEERVKLPKRASADDRSRVAGIKAIIVSARKARTTVKKLYREAGKEQIVQACRDRLSDKAIEWIDAAVAMGTDGKLIYPPLLGTAGSEGRFDYTNNFMSQIANLLIQPHSGIISGGLLRNALFGEATDGLSPAPCGQFDPGRAGGFNQGPGIEFKNFPINAWNFVLTIEGAIVWAPSVARRNAAGRRRLLTCPFTVTQKAMGYSSSSGGDEGDAREIWTPLWNNPVPYRELRAFLSEGRSEVGRRRASDTIEFAEAITSLGVDRGVDSFMRYMLLKRRGDSYVALPAGRFPVQARTGSDLVRELHPLLDRVDRFLRGFKDAPARFDSARRMIDVASYAFLLRGSATRFKELVAAIGRLERLFSERDLSKEPRLRSPLAGLSPRWILAADDGTVEVRIAAALASLRATGKVGPLRANLSPIDPVKPWAWGLGTGQSAWTGNSVCGRLTSVLARRMMDGERLECRSNPLYGSLPIVPEDVAALIEGDIDEALLEELLFGFMWVAWNRLAAADVQSELMQKWSRPVAKRIVSRSWSLLKLVFLPGPLKPRNGNKVEVRSESSLVPLILAGRVGAACEVAARRLNAAGLTPIRARFPDSPEGERLAAGLLVPLRYSNNLADRVLYGEPVSA